MDTRNIDEHDASITFDLLREWARVAFGRDAGETRLHGNAWEALVLALKHAARQHTIDAHAAARAGMQQEFIHNSSDENLTEKELRRRLVSTYLEQATEIQRSIVEAKVNDPWSLFYCTGHDSVDSAWKKWAWYLYCLSFEAGDFSSGWDQSRPDVVCVPLDTVDLQTVAELFAVQITVSQLMDEALRFRPAGAERCAHLLHHRGLWAPLLGSLSCRAELEQLVGSVVEVDALPRELASSRSPQTPQTAFIQSFDAETDCYEVCHGQLSFPLERSSIRRVLLSEAEVSRTDAWTAQAGGAAGSGANAAAPPAQGSAWERWWHGAQRGRAPPLRGISDAALEFQVLHELVRRDARQRLTSMVNELVAAVQPLAAVAAAGSAAGAKGAAAARVRHEPLPTPASSEQQQQQQQQ
eukprot:CAMPEP_0179063488 /NCGR_PEP_ID=MMETSP0796-20121207/27463_1 /TAXON_ID=73915 /ORGANISM="Pyrodinium bahamense, Strain pbaha01" /LENGTH=410 /DNA_ID=CAMNT_0020760415 /DNA_START=33 /DNA_END=1263 /DNA_ORIENTATION=-